MVASYVKMYSPRAQGGISLPAARYRLRSDQLYISSVHTLIALPPGPHPAYSVQIVKIHVGDGLHTNTRYGYPSALCSSTFSTSNATNCSCAPTPPSDGAQRSLRKYYAYSNGLRVIGQKKKPSDQFGCCPMRVVSISRGGKLGCVWWSCADPSTRRAHEDQEVAVRWSLSCVKRTSHRQELQLLRSKQNATVAAPTIGA